MLPRRRETKIVGMLLALLAGLWPTAGLGQAGESGLKNRVVQFPAEFSIGRYVLMHPHDNGVHSDDAVRLSGAHTSSDAVATKFRMDDWRYPGWGFRSGEAQGKIHAPEGAAINVLVRCKDTRHLAGLRPDAIQHLLIERRRDGAGLYGYALQDIEGLTDLQGLTLHALTYNPLYGYTGWGPIAFGDADLKSLKKLRSLRRLDLSRTTFPSKALRHISNLASLRVLNLASTNVTEDGLARIAALPQLESLNLHRVRLSDKGLSNLKRLPGLKELSLGPISMTQPGLKHLKHLTTLTHLRIEFTDASDDGLQQFRPPPNLQHLELSSKRPVSDVGVKTVAGLSQLKTLALWLPVKLDGGGLSDLNRLKALKDLSIRSVPTSTDEGLASLAGLSQIERLSAFNVADVAALMRHLDGHPNLVDLGLRGELNPLKEIPILPRGLPKLRRMRVPHTINDERYAHAWTKLVTQFKSLEELDLFTIDLADRQMRLLKNLNHLKRLKIKPYATDAGLESLSQLGSLEHLVLRNGHFYSDAGLRRLGRMTTLKTLSMTGGGGKVSDAGLAPFANLTSLETLDLDRSYFVTDDALKHFGRLGQLKRLNVRNTRMTADGIASLRRALPSCNILDSFPDFRAAPNHLEGISYSKPLTFEQLAQLKSISNLERLDVHPDQFAEIGLQHLNDLSKVGSLQLASAELTDADLAQLQGLTNLRHLSLGPQVTDAGLKHLSGLTCLESLSLSETQVTTNGLRYLNGLINLRRLRPPKNAGLEHLSALTNLQELSLVSTQATVAELGHIAGLTKLRVLSIRGTELSDAGLERLKDLTSLQELSLSYTRVSSQGLLHLKRLTELRSLGLHGTRVTDAGLANLQGMAGLEILGLDGTQVTDAGLKHLAGLTRLNCLMLQHTRVTDAGLIHLKQLKELQDLRLSGSRVTQQGIKSLRKHLPGIDR